MLMQKLKILGIIFFGFMPLSLAVGTASVQAVDCSTLTGAQKQIQCGANEGAGAAGQDASNAPKTLSDKITTALNILSAVAGVAAVAMFIVAGVRFAGSAGSESAVKGAKTSIIYAIVGLVLVAVAQTVVHFVVVNI